MRIFFLQQSFCRDTEKNKWTQDLANATIQHRLTFCGHLYSKGDATPTASKQQLLSHFYQIYNLDFLIIPLENKTKCDIELNHDWTTWLKRNHTVKLVLKPTRYVS